MFGLKEGNQHHDECIGRQVAIRSANDAYLLSPVLEESRHNMESLVDLTMSINQVTVVHGQNVVHTKVDIDPSLAVFILQEGHFNSRDIAQSPLLGNLLYNLATLSDELVLVVGHSVVKYYNDIDITA